MDTGKNNTLAVAEKSKKLRFCKYIK